MRKHYPSDLTDEQWEAVRPFLPPAKPGGRPRKVDLREVLNTLFYQERTGCQWDFLPHDLLPKSTVRDYYDAWRQDGTWQKVVEALRALALKSEGAGPHPVPRPFDLRFSQTPSPIAGAPLDNGRAEKGRPHTLMVDNRRY